MPGSLGSEILGGDRAMALEGHAQPPRRSGWARALVWIGLTAGLAVACPPPRAAAGDSTTGAGQRDPPRWVGEPELLKRGAGLGIPCVRPSLEIPKPAYLSPVLDTTFGWYVERITNHPGMATTPVAGY